MARKYDLQDPTDLSILHSDFESLSYEDWQSYIDFAKHPDFWKAFSKADRDCLYDMQRQAGKSRNLSSKRILWGLNLIDKIDDLKARIEVSNETAKSILNNNIKSRFKHVTFRVAWHDNKWDGTICKNPLKNRYCSGFHSLLSERLRKRKEQHLSQEIEHMGKSVTPEYIPPCFWSVNAFGHNNLEIKHDNPAEPRLNFIEEKLPAKSIFSWPFSVAFTRDAELSKIEGAYPMNLEQVRVPHFNGKISERKSVGFLYAKYSNPLTEEEQQYLVVGCGLISNKGDYQFFSPMSVIEEKRKAKTKYKHFPSMNWALRYSFEDEDMLVRMPYHEYLDYAQSLGDNEESKQKYIDKIKVAITEPELEHCFKYVAMDVDDDEAIYILSKMRQRLMDCVNDGIVDVSSMENKIRIVDELLSHCWLKRSHFPGFSSICRHLLNWDKLDFSLDGFIEELQNNEGDKYAIKFIDLIENPAADPDYNKYSILLREVKAKYLESYDLTNDHFIKLCLLNLKPFQFQRILSGKLKLSGEWKKTIDDEARSHEIRDICNNPYLLFEEYVSYNDYLDKVTGEVVDSPIELFKIDIAYFPDIRFGIERLSLQYDMSYIDKRRIRALLIRYLRTLENTGHCFADANDIEEAIKDYPLFYNLGEDYTLPPNFFARLSNDYIIHFEENESKIKVVSENDTQYFYLFDVFNAEREIEHVLQSLLQEPDNAEYFSDLETYLDLSCNVLSKKLGTHFNEVVFREERSELYENIYKKKLFVLAGTPGSGKSFELLNVISNLQVSGQKCLILAPTGKAALRLKTDPAFPNIDTSTIDKFIFDIRSGKLSQSDIREVNSLIIDEMSMVDLLKLRTLFRLFNFKIPSFKRLILVGDPNQLPAIGYGKVFKDILYYLNTHPQYNNSRIELQTNCRQELSGSQILEFSDGFITDGEISQELQAKVISGNPDISKGFRVQFWQNEDELNSKMAGEFEYLCGKLGIAGDKQSKLNKLFSLAPDGSILADEKLDLDYFQILTPYNADYYGTGQINELIQSQYKANLKLELMNDWFKQSDKIIRTKNYYVKNKLVLSNGSIGLIRNDKSPGLHFGELHSVMPLYGEGSMRSGDQEFFDLAYAISVHKSQGSGFNHTFFILPNKSGLLSKELVYTALTRSRESITLFIQGEAGCKFDRTVLEKARSRSYTESRRTSLLLDKPFRYYSLEADGIFIESRVELLIYQALKETSKRLNKQNFSFVYEVRPILDGSELPMKTDFTITAYNKVWYWEHLGRLGNKNYEWTWSNLKIPSYKKYNAFNSLITTHEKNGIDPEKINSIIDLILKNELSTEDKTNRYSLHHYSLRG